MFGLPKGDRKLGLHLSEDFVDLNGKMAWLSKNTYTLLMDWFKGKPTGKRKFLTAKHTGFFLTTRNHKDAKIANCHPARCQPSGSTVCWYQNPMEQAPLGYSILFNYALPTLRSQLGSTFIKRQVAHATPLGVQFMVSITCHYLVGSFRCDGPSRAQIVRLSLSQAPSNAQTHGFVWKWGIFPIIAI